MPNPYKPLGSQELLRVPVPHSNLLLDSVTQCLKSDVLAKWIPHSLDHRVGGFQQDFAEDWSTIDDGSRDVVFQSRLIWLASKAAQHFSDEAESYIKFAEHGVNFLTTKLWDHNANGFFWRFPSHPGEPTEKHAYGNAFAIYALSAHYNTMGESRSLDAAKAAFYWLENELHDSKHLGYFEVERSRTDLCEKAFEPDPCWPISNQPGKDAIGTPPNLKSMNTHIHLLEAFTELQEAWPDLLLKERLSEIYELVLTKIFHPDGFLFPYLSADWKPIPTEDSYGHDIETAFLILEAAQSVGFDMERAWTVARTIVDHTLSVAEDQTRGGFYDHGDPYHGPESEEGRQKIWWVQAEALNALLIMHQKFGYETNAYWEAFLRQWEFIQNHQVDKEFGGWFRAVSADGRKLLGATKGDEWTEGYHQGRALMGVSTRLRNDQTAS